MKKAIKKVLRSYLDTPFVSQDFEHVINVKSFPQGYFRSFGEKNADKIFYVIWINGGGSGFFSNVSNVLCHLKIADQFGLIPVVDFLNFKTLFNVENEVNDTGNAWEYYFKQVSEFSLVEVYESKNVLFCSGNYPPSFGYSITQNGGLFEIYSRYISLNKYIEDIIKEKLVTLELQNRVLGIHFRGQEQKIAPGHSFPPTEKQMIKYCDLIIEKHQIEKIFLVTEEQSYLDLLINRYEDKVVYSNSYRTYNVNAYNLNPRENHRYYLGLEVLVDAFLLSNCTGLLCSDSNVSEFARFVNNNRYEFSYQILNGINSSNRLLARFLYGLKRNLPGGYGGLLNKLVVYDNRIT